MPVDASLAEVKEAFQTDNSEVIAMAARARYAECAETVGAVLRWFVSQPAEREKTCADVLGSLFGARLRQGLPDSVLAQRNKLTLEQFEAEKQRLLSALGLRQVSAGDLQAAS